MIDVYDYFYVISSPDPWSVTTPAHTLPRLHTKEQYVTYGRFQWLSCKKAAKCLLPVCASR